MAAQVGRNFGGTVTLIEAGILEGTWALGVPVHILIIRKEGVQLNKPGG